MEMENLGGCCVHRYYGEQVRPEVEGGGGGEVGTRELRLCWEVGAALQAPCGGSYGGTHTQHSLARWGQ